MKTSKYQKLLISELEEIKARLGEAEMQKTCREFKNEGQEAMSRELVVQLISKLNLLGRIKFLLRHKDLVIPYLFRVKQRSTSTTQNK